MAARTTNWCADGFYEWLTPDERDRVVARVVQRAEKRATVIAGLHAWNTPQAVDEGRGFRELGADGLLVSIAEKDPELSAGEPLTPVIAHFTAIVREVGLPTMYDHVPSDLSLSLEEVEDLFAEVSLVGIRNGTPNGSDIRAQMKAVGRPISMFTSRSYQTLDCLAAGGVGAMCPLVTVLPLTARRLIEKHRAGNDAGAKDAEAHLERARPFVTTTVPHESVHLPLTEALAAVGIVGPAISRKLAVALSDVRRKTIRELARELVEL